MKFHIYIKQVLLIAALACIPGTIYSQDRPQNATPIKISGVVFDKGTTNPMQYATVSLREQADSSIVNGIITDGSGKFSIQAKEPGSYFLQFNFVGYDTYVKDLEISGETTSVDAGSIYLEKSSLEIEEVTVEAVNRAVEYRIDRKVVNVGEMYASMSGTAIDLLKNVPSIDVDIEDNVSIRGNSNFTVLIDGRPSVLSGSEALQQFPAGMIKNIEIITNPSAKYDPEGTGGIINIVTKKRTLTGLSGLINADIGVDRKYGGDFLLNFRTEKFNYFLGGDYSKRNYPGNIETKQETYAGDTISYLDSDGSYERRYGQYSARGGIEWFPNENNTFIISGRYGYRLRSGVSDEQYTDWTNFAPARNIYTNEEKWQRDGNYYSVSTDFIHNFNGTEVENQEHKLDANFMFYNRNGDEESVNFLYDEARLIRAGQKSTESGPSKGIEYRVNYMKPFTKAFSIEAGAQGRVSESDESNELYNYLPDTDNYEFQDLYSNDVSYKRNIHALYGLLKGEFNKLGYQLGLRGEYTYRDILMKEQGEFNIDRWDYFPSVHMSYKLSEKDQFMASYSRRIDRPRGWYLEPFITWGDAYNVRRGNPDLQPEYINSYEIGYQRELSEKNVLSAEVYYRVTDEKIERIREVFRDNIMLSTYANVGTDYALGSEIMLNTDLTKWWESSFSGNFYNYRVKGEINGEKLDRESFTWSVEWNSIFKITDNTRIQINPEYDSREIEAQETESASFEIDAGIRQSLVNDRLNLTLQFRDVFNTDRHESEIDAKDFYSYRLYTHDAPVVMLNISWRINNFRNGRNSRNAGGGGFGGDPEM